MADRVGFVGLGAMGLPMARNLVAAGWAPAVHSRSPGPVDELVAEGAAGASSAAEVAARSDVVITMVPDTPDVEAVLFGPAGVAAGVAEGSLVIDMSTIDPIATRGFAERLAAQGVGMLDAPVSGGTIGARDGTLSIMVGGSEADLARAMPLFEVLGSTVVHAGPVGSGQITKACNQLAIAGTLEAVSEALVLARKAGVEPAKVREALLGGFAASKVLEVHGRRMLDGDFAPGFRAALMLKDVRIVAHAARELGVAVPGLDAVARELERLVAEGGADLDYSALVTVRERDAGVSVRDAGQGT
jgi:2-hydroxy-3-oxopropionate reductase